MNGEEYAILGSTPLEWVVALTTTGGVLGLLWLARAIFLRRAAELGPRLRATTVAGRPVGALLVALARQTRAWVLIVLAIYLGSLFLDVSNRFAGWRATIGLGVLMYQAAVWGNVFIDVWLRAYEEQYLSSDAGRVTSVRALAFVARLVLITLVVLLVLDNVPGVQVTTLIASLGITGLAVALAVQNILSDLFASLSIALDKPFVIGDFIIVGDLQGTVEEIGLKTTRLRSLWGEELVFANSDLLGSRIRNFRRMQERRIAYPIQVVHETPPEVLERIPAILQEIVTAQPNTRFDRAHLTQIGEYALRFELVYYMLTPQFQPYVDVQQAIHLAMLRRFREEGIRLAYPTQTLRLEHTPEDRA